MRTIFNVRPISHYALEKKDPQTEWVIDVEGNPIGYSLTKKYAVKAAARTARMLTGICNAQVRIWGKDGKIKSERTYGADPKKTKG